MLACLQTMFCGMWEFSGISDYETPEDAMRDMRENLMNLGGYKRRIPFVMFSGTVETPSNLGHCNGRTDNYAEALATYIEENGLGTVLRTQHLHNWTGNKTMVCIWQIEDHKKLWEFLAKFDDED